MRIPFTTTKQFSPSSSIVSVATFTGIILLCSAPARDSAVAHAAENLNVDGFETAATQSGISQCAPPRPHAGALEGSFLEDSPPTGSHTDAPWQAKRHVGGVESSGELHGAHTGQTLSILGPCYASRFGSVASQ